MAEHEHAEIVDHQPRRNARADLAFKRAMLAAIKSGAEVAVPCVIRGRRRTRYIAITQPLTDCGYRSSAGYCADMGDKGGFGPNA